MNKVLLVLAACLGILYMLVSILMDEGNAIGSVSRYLVVASFVLGLANPKVGLFWIIILAGYSDLMKRAMVFDYRFDQMDVFWVRALVPLTLGAIFIGILVRGLRDPFIFQKRHVISLGLCFGGFLIAGASAARSDGLTGALMLMADGYSCMFLIFIIPCLFRSSDEVMTFAKYCLIIFVPVALYGLKQQFFGLSDFEIEYLKSGRTVLSKHLEDVRPRPFSTLCDSSPYATTCAILACIALMLRGYYARLGMHVGRIQNLLLWALFVAACITSMCRMPNMNWLLPMLLLSPLRSGRGTAALYGGMALTYVLLCVFAMEAKAVVETATVWALNHFGHTDLGEQFARFWTLGARLDGMDDLVHNPRMWTAFGYGPAVADAMVTAGDVHSHDSISSSLLIVGYVPTFIFLAGVCGCLWVLHRAALTLKNHPADFSAAIWMLATIFGLVMHNVFGGSITSTTPVNFFFWFMAGAINTMIGYRQREAKPAAAANSQRPGFARPLVSPHMPRSHMPHRLA